MFDVELVKFGSLLAEYAPNNLNPCRLEFVYPFPDTLGLGLFMAMTTFLIPEEIILRVQGGVLLSL